MGSLKNIFIALCCALTSCHTHEKVNYLPYYTSADFTPHFVDLKNADTLHVIPEFTFTNQNGEAITRKNFDNKMDENGRVIGSSFTGYTLTGTVTVHSREIEKVEKLSREVTNLLENGIEFSSTPPSYYYSKLNDLKIDLLAKAAEDAKLRAQTIAKNSDVNLGTLKTANMGVFQITGKNLNEDYSYGGAFNTSSKEKTASITLKVEYQMR